MRQLFYAQSIAVIGVSESEDNLGRNILNNLLSHGYQGKIFAVGPRGNEVLGISIFRSVAELPQAADVAVILTPARSVPEILTQCGEKGIRWVVIESGGFREMGHEGKSLEDEVTAICNRYGISFVGPNCVGIVSSAMGICTPFVPLPKFRTGKVSVIAQSGGVGIAMAERISSSGVGINKLVSVGNKLRLDEADYLKYLIGDPDTSIISFYLEDFKRGRVFVETAAASSKPIVVHKSNTSSLSNNIAQSHTAALAGDDAVVDAVCREAGIIRVRTGAQLVNCIRGLSMQRLRGKNLAVISRSGGHSVVAADNCAKYGFDLPPFEEKLIEQVRSRSRAKVIRLGNPLDLGDVWDLPYYKYLAEAVLQQEHIHGMVFIHVDHAIEDMEPSRQLMEHLRSLAVKYDKPVAVALEAPYKQQHYLHETVSLPMFHESAEAIEALACQWEHGKSAEARMKRKAPENFIPSPGKIEEWLRNIEAGKRQPLLHEALELLRVVDIPTAPWKLSLNLSDALSAAEAMGYPVALKGVAPSLLHKSDKGAIAINVESPTALEKEWRRISGLADDLAGVLVQKMVFASRELILGAKRDASFGPVVMVGLGGIMVEALKDVSMRLAPIGNDTAVEMLKELSGSKILGPFRGMSEAPIDAIAEVAARISSLMDRFPQIAELDINPLSIEDDGGSVAALDARVLLATP